MRDFLQAFDHILTGYPEAFPWYIALLLGTGIFITLRLGFIQIRAFGHAIDVIRGRYDDPEDKGDATHFQALTMALSATVGVGNIAGVALAIHFGGPGAVFWMWVTAVFGMALKYSECTLALKHRVFDEAGEAAGGPMYYIEKGLGMKRAAVFFAACAVICSFATGNMNQSNTIASLFAETGKVSTTLVGALVTAVVGVVIVGGVHRIAQVTEKLAPTMGIVYFLGAGTIVLLRIGEVPRVLAEIVTGAFQPTAAFGGSAAGVFILTLLHGVRRGIFSNEAGQGSAAIAHASARTDEPVREGVVAMTGPFIDTLVICSLTAFAILLTGTWNQRVPQSYGAGQVVVCSRVEQGRYLRLTGPVRFVAGHLEGGVLAASHATVDHAVARLGDEPYTGTLTTLDGALIDAPEGLVLEGEGLLVGAPLTAEAFRVGLAPVTTRGDLIVFLSVLLFAISTIISWSYYGDRSAEYLFGVRAVLPYRLLYLAFCFLGAITSLELVWQFGDIALSLMSIPNLVAILMLHRSVLEDTREYFGREHVPFR